MSSIFGSAWHIQRKEEPAHKTLQTDDDDVEVKIRLCTETVNVKRYEELQKAQQVEEQDAGWLAKRRDREPIRLDLPHVEPRRHITVYKETDLSLCKAPREKDDETVLRERMVPAEGSRSSMQGNAADPHQIVLHRRNPPRIVYNKVRVNIDYVNKNIQNWYKYKRTKLYKDRFEPKEDSVWKGGLIKAAARKRALEAHPDDEFNPEALEPCSQFRFEMHICSVESCQKSAERFRCGMCAAHYMSHYRRHKRQKRRDQRANETHKAFQRAILYHNTLFYS